ncbi:MAG: PAS domain S-box protein [Candidatus Omnitrophica bacterium]|nr:PAS domain S-box protein [Candidatus Omnitrophota bacterium]
MSSHRPKTTPKRSRRDLQDRDVPSRKVLPKGRPGSSQRVPVFQDAEAQYRAAVDSFEGLVYGCSRDYKVIFANRRIKKRAGYDPVGKKCYHVLHARRSVCPWCPNKKVFKGQAVRWDICSPKDGRWYHCVNTPLYDRNKIVGKMAMITDINDRKRTEALLGRREAHLSAIIENQPGMVWLKDAGGKFLAVNKKFVKACGLHQAKEVVGKTDFDIWPRKLARRYTADDKKVMRTRKPLMVTEPIEDQGVLKWFETFKTSVIDENGKASGTAGYACDITDRQRTAEAIRESERLHASLVRNLPGFVYRCRNDRSWTMQYLSPGCFAVTGYRPDELINNRRFSYNHLVLPAYRKPLWKLWQRLLAKRERFKGEYPIRAANGEVRWVWERGQGIFDQKGKLLYLQGYIEDVTDRRRADVNLKRALSLQRATLESTADGILVVDRSGKVEDYNQKFSQLWRLPLRVLQQKDDEKLLRLVLRQLKDPAGFLSGVRWYYAHPRKSGFDVLEFKDGRIFERESHPQWIGKTSVGRVWSFRDVTERNKMETALRESRRELREIIDTVPHLICAKDREGRFLMANRVLAELYGMTPETILGKKQGDLHLVKSEARVIRREDLAVLKTGNPKIYGSGIFTDSRKCHHFFQKYKVPFKFMGRTAPAVLVVAVDVTEHRKVEDFRNEIVRTLSHELRTPLSIEKGGISLLLDGSAGKISAEQKLLLETVMRNIDRLSRMIDKLLDVARIESGQWKLMPSEVDLRDAVRDAVSEFDQMKNRSGVRLKAVCGKQAAKVWADRDGIAQVLTNLIGNACKFTQKGFVEVTVRVSREEIECNVKDTGIGISPENMAKMFESFQQFSWPDSAGKEGIGLGLTISKKIIE